MSRTGNAQPNEHAALQPGRRRSARHPVLIGLRVRSAARVVATCTLSEREGTVRDYTFDLDEAIVTAETAPLRLRAGAAPVGKPGRVGGLRGCRRRRPKDDRRPGVRDEAPRVAPPE